MHMFWLLAGAALLVAALFIPIAFMMDSEQETKERIGTACVQSGGEWIREDFGVHECHRP